MKSRLSLSNTLKTTSLTKNYESSHQAIQGHSKERFSFIYMIMIYDWVKKWITSPWFSVKEGFALTTTSVVANRRVYGL